MASHTAPNLTGAGVLAVVQLAEGGLDDTGKGLLNEAGKLAALLGAPLEAACFSPGEPAADATEDFGGRLSWPASGSRFLRALGASPVPLEPFAAYGVGRVLELTADRDLTDLPDACAHGLAQAASRRGAGVVLLAHDDRGSSLAPGLAAALEAALWTENVAFTPGPEGLVLSRETLGNRALERSAWDGAQPLVLTIDPKRMSATRLPSQRPARPPLEQLAVSPPKAALQQRILERIAPDPQTVDVSEAEVIFCAGKGFDADSFSQFQELARLLSASLGVTRPVYDLGWTGFERMIGQTGKTVAPRFYLGMGISGSMHHVGGIKDSKRLISLNIDPKVPMFPNSDEGFVGDIREVLPRLLDKVRSHLATTGAGGGAA